MFIDVSKGTCEGTSIPATQDHISEDPNLKKYPILDPQVPFYCPLQQHLMAGSDARFFQLLPEKRGDPSYVVIVFC